MLNVKEEVEFGKALEDAALWPACVEADHVAPEEPGCGLFDAGLFEIFGERRLAGGGGVAGEDVAAGVGDSAG